MKYFSSHYRKCHHQKPKLQTKASESPDKQTFHTTTIRDQVAMNLNRWKEFDELKQRVEKAHS